MNFARSLVPSLIVAAALLCSGRLDAGAAMWVYETGKIMKSKDEQAALFTFCQKRDITDLFWQVHFVAQEGGQFALSDVEITRAFLREAAKHRMRIHALAGDPAHALTRNHVKVLARVDELVRFNAAAEKDERFVGLHLDIEPHGLPEWKVADNEQKCEILAQFVEVNAKAVERLRATAPELIYGTDIVFWLDKVRDDGSAAYPVKHRGMVKDAAKHLLDIVDNVGIMSYRDHVEGKNGILSLVSKTIAYADTTKGKAYVGVKMANIGPSFESYFGKSEEEMQADLKQLEESLGGHRSYAGIAYFMYEAFRAMPVKTGQ